MGTLFPLRDVAQGIAFIDGRDADVAEHIHQRIRGWAQRGLLSAAGRESAGATAARIYTLEDACLIRLLLLLHEFLGMGGDELRRLGVLLRFEETDVLPDGTHIHSGLAAAVPGIAAGENWTFAVTLSRDTLKSGKPHTLCQLVRDRHLKDPTTVAWQLLDGNSLLCGFLKIPATALLAPLIAWLLDHDGNARRDLYLTQPPPAEGAGEKVKIG